MWSEIWTANEALKNGYQWVVGNGQDIEVYKDRWLRDKVVDYRVEDSLVNAHKRDKVCDFFIPGTKRWDELKVRRSFQEIDAKKILAISIPQMNLKDRIA